MELCAPLELEVNFVGKLKISMSVCSEILREMKRGLGNEKLGKSELGEKGRKPRIEDQKRFRIFTYRIIYLLSSWFIFLF